MRMTDWREKTFSLTYIYNSLSIHERWNGEDIPAMEFLKNCMIVPADVVWKRRNSMTRTSLSAAGIPAGYLAELAYDWDKDGPSSPRDFVHALEFEISGHPRNDEVSQVLGSLGR